VKRCAIYTRKSTEEGLEQAFNTLHAQREACEAYIKSQAGEGWRPIPTLYDDGGFSGGNMGRPAMQRLLADIEQGLVDVVVVYKVDRLTRSLGDFARIVEAFDRKSVSFVSVTQAFNTTTSMGRLTLNVLLSFAQFEREVTGERIRDKIAASKKKGLWMAGIIPLGYRVEAKRLVIEEAEAEIIRMIFRRYLALGSVKALRAELEALGVRSKAWTTRAGKAVGGVPFSTGALYALLKNRHYTGAIVHKDIFYPDQHPAIIPLEDFDEVQASLHDKAARARERRQPCEHAPLKGLIHSNDRLLTPSFAYGKRGGRYRYYVLADTPQSAPDQPPTKIPAIPFEALVLQQLQRFAADGPMTILDAVRLIHRIDLRPASIELVVDAKALQPQLHPELALDGVRTRLHPGERALPETSDARRIRISLPIRAQFRGGRTWIEGATPLPAAARTSKAKPEIKAVLRRSHELVRSLGASPLKGPMAPSAAPASTYAVRLARLAFLSPELQLDLLHGRHPAHLTAKALIDNQPPLAWSEQRAWLEGL